MIVVTGGAGFIGCNLVTALNLRGLTDILVVDNLKNGIKFKNLIHAKISDYLDKTCFADKIKQGRFDGRSIEAVFHQGACSTTTEWDGRYMMENNYEYSKTVLRFCLERQIPFIYASSGAVYGAGKQFVEDPVNEAPLNVYGYSKLQFDRYLRKQFSEINTQVVGLRYFNVYGYGEAHKGSMASIAYHLNDQLLNTGTVRLFEGCDGFSDGEQRRDFVYVEDVAAVNLWFLDHPEVSGIFNVGTGQSQTFNNVANAVVNFHGKGLIEYIPFPEHLKGHYQSFTQADITALRGAGCTHRFLTVEQGVKSYLEVLNIS